MDPYRAPPPGPPPARDPMRVVLVATGSLAALIAVVAVAFGVLDCSPKAQVAATHAVGACMRDECGPAPSLYCPAGVAPSCARKSGVCTWDLPAECTTEPPCPNGGSPPLCNATASQADAPPPTASPRRWAPRRPLGGVSKQAAALSLAGDNAGARSLLEPRVFGGHAGPDEVRMLQGLCKSQHDAECVAAIEKRYPP